MNLVNVTSAVKCSSWRGPHGVPFHCGKTEGEVGLHRDTDKLWSVTLGVTHPTYNWNIPEKTQPLERGMTLRAVFSHPHSLYRLHHLSVTLYWDPASAAWTCRGWTICSHSMSRQLPACHEAGPTLPVLPSPSRRRRPTSCRLSGLSEGSGDSPGAERPVTLLAWSPVLLRCVVASTEGSWTWRSSDSSSKRAGPWWGLRSGGRESFRKCTPSWVNWTQSLKAACWSKSQLVMWFLLSVDS